MNYKDSEYVQLEDALAEGWNLDVIEDATQEAEEELTSEVSVQICSDPYGDYVETDFYDRKEAEKKFYNCVAEDIRRYATLSERLAKLAKKIPDEELCSCYADVVFDDEKIVDMAIDKELNRVKEGERYYD